VLGVRLMGNGRPVGKANVHLARKKRAEGLALIQALPHIQVNK